MLKRETLSALRAYTSLSTGIQGQLTLRNAKYGIVHDIETDDDFQAILHKMPQITRCVRSATFHKDVLDPGIHKTGPFFLKGLVLKGSNNGMYGVLDVSRPGMQDNTHQLVSYKQKDVISCEAKQNIIFATVPIASELIPPWKYIHAVLYGPVKELLVVCCNGFFLLKRNLSIVLADAKDAELIYEMLIQYDIVVAVRTSAQANTVIYRLAKNALLIGPDDYANKLEELQDKLQVNFHSANTTTISAPSSDYQIKDTVVSAEPNASQVTYDQIQELQDEMLDADHQPLRDWQLPRRTMSLELWIEPQTGAAKNLMTHSMRRVTDKLAINIVVHRLEFREREPGENEFVLREHLQRLVFDIIDMQLKSLSIDKSQNALDQFTNSIVHLLKLALVKSTLFPVPTSCKVHVELSVTEGQVVKLPTGKEVVIPRHALNGNSVRLSTFLGGLAKIGLEAKFYSWHQLESGIPLS